MDNQQVKRGAPGWVSSGQKIKCVMMCGGKGTRFGPTKGHKSFADVNGAPLISHVINYWRQFTDDFVFVVKHGKDVMVDYISTLPIKAQFVEPGELKGIADGLSYARPYIDSPFVMVLGDCFCAGRFDFPADMEWGIGVLPNATDAQMHRNYAVFSEAGRVTEVEEKPQVIRNHDCGMGFYFLQPDIFDYIPKTAPSARTGELEITDVLQTLVDHDVDLKAVMLEGNYVNVTTPDDLALVAEALDRYQIPA